MGTSLTIEQCNQWWWRDQTVNPLTGKRIKIHGPTWQRTHKAWLAKLTNCVPLRVFPLSGDGKEVAEIAERVFMCEAVDDADVLLIASDGEAEGALAAHGKTAMVLTPDVLANVVGLARSSVAEEQGLRDEIERISLNHEDPVTFEAWKDMTDEQLRSIVRLGSEVPGRCYCLTLDTAYNIYKTAVESGKPEWARNPIAPDRPFSKEEIDYILDMMRKADPAFRAPAKHVPMLRRGVELEMRDVMVPVRGYVFHFVHVSVMDRAGRAARTLHNVGFIPGWIETEHIGSADYTSGVLLTNLWSLWNERKFFPKYEEPYQGCRVGRLNNARKPYTPATWFDRVGFFRQAEFVALCQEVSDVLAE